MNDPMDRLSAVGSDFEEILGVSGENLFKEYEASVADAMDQDHPRQGFTEAMPLSTLRGEPGNTDSLAENEEFYRSFEVDDTDGMG